MSTLKLMNSVSKISNSPLPPNPDPEKILEHSSQLPLTLWSGQGGSTLPLPCWCDSLLPAEDDCAHYHWVTFLLFCLCT